MRHLIVYNPAAGRGRSERAADVVAEAFAHRGLDHELIVTERPGHAQNLLAEQVGEDLVALVVGGDGTLHEVLQGLDLERHRLAVLPWGTGNDFAWAGSWPLDLDTCLDRITRGAEARGDVGLWEARTPGGPASGRFHNNTGLGFEAVVNRESHRIQRLKGPMVYVAALFKSLPRFRKYPVTISWDDGRFEGEVPLLAVTNGPRVGGAFLLTPAARNDDGKLDLVWAPGVGLLKLLSLFPRSFTGAHVRSGSIRTAVSSRVSITSPNGIPLYVDGEFVAMDVLELTLGLLAGGLRTFAPASSGESS